MVHTSPAAACMDKTPTIQLTQKPPRLENVFFGMDGKPWTELAAMLEEKMVCNMPKKTWIDSSFGSPIPMITVQISVFLFVACKSQTEPAPGLIELGGVGCSIPGLPVHFTIQMWCHPIRAAETQDLRIWGNQNSWCIALCYCGIYFLNAWPLPQLSFHRLP